VQSALATDIRLADYAPRSTLVLERHEVERAAVNAIDVHTHLGRWLAPTGDWVASDLGGAHANPWMATDAEELLAMLDSVNVGAAVNLDGRWGDELEANLDRYDRPHPDRFLTFCHVDWSRANQGDDFANELVSSLRRSADAGARGLKVWKTLGLGFRDARGELLMPDDERAADVFAAAGELGLPVLIHTADPVAFFDPVDSHNERLEELLLHPEWSFQGPGLPSHERLIDSFESLLSGHRATTFIGAHVAGCVEDLGRVARMLDEHPNLYLDLSARVGDLGRQPRAARRLLVEHADRVLFGTDLLPPSASGYRGYFRFLETADEAFAYSESEPPPSGRWTISALELPDQVLESVYADNARRLLGLDDD
jgi:predicted TIM-barrel fold metal-dependent hydrolase